MCIYIYIYIYIHIYVAYGLLSGAYWLFAIYQHFMPIVCCLLPRPVLWQQRPERRWRSSIEGASLATAGTVEEIGEQVGNKQIMLNRNSFIHIYIYIYMDRYVYVYIYRYIYTVIMCSDIRRYIYIYSYAQISICVYIYIY